MGLIIGTFLFVIIGGIVLVVNILSIKDYRIKQINNVYIIQKRIGFWWRTEKLSNGSPKKFFSVNEAKEEIDKLRKKRKIIYY